MEIVITLTDYETKVVAHTRPDVEADIQLLVHSHIEHLAVRLAQNLVTKVSIDGEALVTEMFADPDYQNAAQKALAIAVNEAELAAIKDT